MKDTQNSKQYWRRKEKTDRKRCRGSQRGTHLRELRANWCISSFSKGQSARCYLPWKFTEN